MLSVKIRIFTNISKIFPMHQSMPQVSACNVFNEYFQQPHSDTRNVEPINVENYRSDVVRERYWAVEVSASTHFLNFSYWHLFHGLPLAVPQFIVHKSQDGFDDRNVFWKSITFDRNYIRRRYICSETFHDINRNVFDLKNIGIVEQYKTVPCIAAQKHKILETSNEQHRMFWNEEGT